MFSTRFSRSVSSAIDGIACLAVSPPLVEMSVLGRILVPFWAVRFHGAARRYIQRTRGERVLAYGAGPEMIGINACTVSTEMVNAKAVRNGAVVYLIRNTMGLLATYDPVSIGTQPPPPNPAVGCVRWDDYAQLKSLRICQAATKAPIGTEVAAFRWLARVSDAARRAGSGMFRNSHFVPSLAAGGEERGGVTSTVRAPLIVQQFCFG